MARTNHTDGGSGSSGGGSSIIRYKESGNKFIAMKKYSAAMVCYRRVL